MIRRNRHRATSSLRPSRRLSCLSAQVQVVCAPFFPRCQLRKALFCMLFVSQNSAFATSVRRGRTGHQQNKRLREGKEGRKEGEVDRGFALLTQLVQPIIKFASHHLSPTTEVTTVLHTYTQLACNDNLPTPFSYCTLSIFLIWPIHRLNKLINKSCRPAAHMHCMGSAAVDEAAAIPCDAAFYGLFSCAEPELHLIPQLLQTRKQPEV